MAPLQKGGSRTEGRLLPALGVVDASLVAAEIAVDRHLVPAGSIHHQLKHDGLQKRVCFFKFSLCLSRACLGKKDHF